MRSVVEVAPVHETNEGEEAEVFVDDVPLVPVLSELPQPASAAAPRKATTVLMKRI
jgi:hypothetical protein